MQYRGRAARINPTKMDTTLYYRYEYQTAYLPLTAAPGTTLNNVVVNLASISPLIDVFASNKPAPREEKAVFKSIRAVCKIRCANELDTTRFTVFVISPKPMAYGSVYQTASVVPTLIGGRDYSPDNASVGSFSGNEVRMNAERWNVHYCKRFSLGSENLINSDLSQGEVRKDLFIDLPINGIVKATYTGQTCWDQMPQPSQYRHHRYLVIFHDNINTSTESNNPEYMVNRFCKFVEY